MAKNKRRGRVQAPENETKAARFTRVVSPRVGKAVKAIGVIGYCAGSPYEYKEEQVQQILTALSNAVVSLKDRFAKKEDKQAGFEFKA